MTRLHYALLLLLVQAVSEDNPAREKMYAPRRLVPLRGRPEQPRRLVRPRQRPARPAAGVEAARGPGADAGKAGPSAGSCRSAPTPGRRAHTRGRTAPGRPGPRGPAWRWLQLPGSPSNF